MELFPPLFFLPLFFLISLLFFTSSSAFRVFPFSDCRENVNIEGSKVASSTITVDKTGHGKFNTIQAAIDSIPSQNTQWVIVQINPGIYKEKVYIPPDKPYIFLKGLGGRDQTTVTFDDHDQTDTSATFSSFADNVAVQGITFKNSFNLAAALNFDYQMNLVDEITNGVNVVKPAVAARIYGDKSAFFECGFIGLQDTLFDVQGRHYFKSCYIEGAIDFIFGSGQSFYEDTMINATVGTSLSATSVGFITAQGRSSSNDPSGFVFKGGLVFGSGQVLLGRAYRPYSRVIFYGTNLGAVVAPQGWDVWNQKGHEGNIMYAEVNCQGRGSDTSNRVAWEKNMSSSAINKYYSKSSFVDQDSWISKLPESGELFK